MLVVGLTGSIGMGKSTTANLFREAGIPVHDADASVHQLYSAQAAPPIEALFPGTTAGGVVDRAKLSARVLGKPDALRALEGIVHPLVRAREEAFLGRARAAGERMVVLDIPLLIESGAAGRVDLLLVVTAPSSVQKARVLARPGMNEEKLAAILARQVPDSEKRRQAHMLIDTSRGVDAARDDVREFLRASASLCARTRAVQ